MTKKAQFIIPNVFIKEAFGAGMTRGLMLLTKANKGPVTASLTRALQSGVRRGNPVDASTVRTLFKDLRAAGTTRGSVSRNELAAKLRALRAGKTAPTPQAAPNPRPQAAPNPRSQATPNPALQAAPNPRPQATPNPAPQATPNPAPQAAPNPTMRQAKGRVVEPAPQPSPTALATTPPPLPATAAESAAYSPGLINRALSSTAGRVALPVATGAVGYGFGNSRGYDEGFGQGALSAQQMAAIQAMQMQQQARQMYDNQGFLDRLMGRNPF